MSGTENQMTGAEIVLQALKDNGVEHIFGYPGGAVLPIYDEIFQQEDIRTSSSATSRAPATGRRLCPLHRQGRRHAGDFRPGSDQCGHAAAGRADGLDPARLHLGAGTDVADRFGRLPECDTIGITRPCTKHNWLVRDVNELARVIHEAFRVAQSGRPGPVVVDIPKDVQFATGTYTPPSAVPTQKSYQPKTQGDLKKIEEAVALMKTARQPVIYSGGGVINSGPQAAHFLRELVELTGFPITSTLMGLGAYPASGKNWLGMLGMHGTYEANLAMHDCDVMICIGARFDDRITGRLNAFSPNSKKIHIDIDPSSINKNVRVDVPIIGDVAAVLEDMIRLWRAAAKTVDQTRLGDWWKSISKWRARNSLAYTPSADVIMPQYAIQRLYELPRTATPTSPPRSPAPDVGRAVLRLRRAEPLDDLGRPRHHGLRISGRGRRPGRASGEPRHRHRRRRVDPDCIQEMSCAVQYGLPVKIFILNNQYMGMVRQWQQLLHGNRLSHSYTEAMPDFVKLAEAYGGVGIRCEKPGELDDAIRQMIDTPAPVIFDCRVANLANCFPMIPSGKAHNEMLLPDEATDEVVANAIDAKGRQLV